MVLHIRNMESTRCISMVKDELHKHGLRYKTVELGEVELIENITVDKLQQIDFELRQIGLEIIFDAHKLLIEKIKAVIHQLICYTDDFQKPNTSEFISKHVNIEYSKLSYIFSMSQSTTIEKYIIIQKIERVKELLVYENLSLKDIAYNLHYSSVAHLSNQFKKVTGLTPALYRQLRNDSIKNV